MSEARKLFLTDKCCCIFSLETGGLIIGCIETLLSTLFVIGIIGSIKQYWGETCEVFEKDPTFEKISSVVDDCETAKTLWMAYFFFLLAVYLINVIVTVVFMIGVKKRNHKLVFPVIIWEIVTLVFFLIEQIVAFTKIAFAVGVVFGALSIYFLIIFLSLYYKFKDESGENPRYSPAKRTNEQHA